MKNPSDDVIPYDYQPARTAVQGSPARVLVLMHGRGATRKDLAPLRAHLPGDWHVVLPEAPHRGAAWGYGPGSAWYRFLGDNQLDAPTMEVSLAALDGLVEALPSIVGAPVDRVVVGGFSQGGTMGHAFALTRRGRVQGVLNFSGFLASHIPVDAANVRGIRFFWGHGIQDPAIPFSLAERGRAALGAAGADLEARDYGIGHWIDPSELGDASGWLQRF